MGWELGPPGRGFACCFRAGTCCCRRNRTMISEAACLSALGGNKRNSVPLAVGATKCGARRWGAGQGCSGGGPRPQRRRGGTLLPAWSSTRDTRRDRGLGEEDELGLCGVSFRPSRFADFAAELCTPVLFFHQNKGLYYFSVYLAYTPPPCVIFTILPPAVVGRYAVPKCSCSNFDMVGLFFLSCCGVLCEH